MMKRRSGFTLIELLVAIAIIGILAAFLFANFSSMRERSRDARRKGDLDQMKKTLRLYYNDQQKYPSAAGGKIVAVINTISTSFEWGKEFNAGGVVYTNQLPLDPLGTQSYQYYSNGVDKYCLVATMENSGDAEIAKSQARCANTCKSLKDSPIFAPDFTVSPQPTGNALLYPVCSD